MTIIKKIKIWDEEEYAKAKLNNNLVHCKKNYFIVRDEFHLKIVCDDLHTAMNVE